MIFMLSSGIYCSFSMGKEYLEEGKSVGSDKSLAVERQGVKLGMSLQKLSGSGILQ
ncbi:MAG: hypothetical protein J6B02_00640 [Selenomonadales bacterium]|nr:hypothetical protein [Selenomonadales bacterium]